jgi:hypothetical protein
VGFTLTPRRRKKRRVFCAKRSKRGGITNAQQVLFH